MVGFLSFFLPLWCISGRSDSMQSKKKCFSQFMTKQRMWRQPDHGRMVQWMPHPDGSSRFRWSPARRQHRSPREFQCIGWSNRYRLAAPRWEPDKCCCLVLRLSHGRKLITQPDHGGRSYTENIVRNPDRKKPRMVQCISFFLPLSLSLFLSLSLSFDY